MNSVRTNRRIRGLRRRVLSAAAVAAVVLPALILATPLPSQARGNVSLFSLPRSQDENFELHKAQEDLAAARTAGSRRSSELLQSAVERLHRLIHEENGGVVEMGVGRYWGLYRATLDTLRRLSPEAREVYEKLARRKAGALMRRPLPELSEAQLLELAEDYPVSEVGRRARRYLGDRALESGRSSEAAKHYLAALDAVLPRSAAARALEQRMQMAKVVTHPSQYSSRAQPRMDPKTVTQVMEAVPTGGDGTWPNYAGGGAGIRPMEAPAGNPASELALNISAPGFEDNSYAMHAVGDLGAIYINNGQRIYALSPLGRDVIWLGDGPMVGQSVYYQGVVNPDTVLSAGLGQDVVVAALQVPDDTEDIVFRRGTAIVNQIPERRLFGFDRETGKRIWGHWDTLNGPLDRQHRNQVPAGPPLVHGDTVYVPTHDPRGTIAFYLRAYDLHTGEQRWQRLLCSSQQEVNMFGNANMEFASSPLAFDGGVLYGSTNLGICYAIDGADGRIRWLAAYDVIPLTRNRGRRYQNSRATYFANNSPVITDGVAAFTPLDSYNAMGFDTEAGNLLWRMNYQARESISNRVRWLLGAMGDEFIFSGLGVVGVKARPESNGLAAQIRQIKAPTTESLRYAPFLPRGAITEDFIYHPTLNKLSIFDSRGNPNTDIATQTALPPRLGNLLMVNGILVSVDGNDKVHITYDRESLLRRAEEQVNDDSNNVLALYRQAALLRAAARDNVEGPQGDRAETVYRRGLAAARSQGMGSGTPLYDRLSRELFELSLSRGESQARTAPLKALVRLRSARQDAPDREAWLRAQMLILECSRAQPQEYLEELDLMASQFGRQRHDFPEVGYVPIQAYALWLGTQVEEEPAAAVQRCQEILESFNEEQFGGQSLRAMASNRLKELLDTHGREFYAEIENRAMQALATAGVDPASLRLVANGFPHSQSADRAMALLLDIAAENGDLGAAADAYSKAVSEGQESPRLLRRMMVASERGGNPELAGAIARRLLALHGDAVSDFPPDRGQTYRQVVPAPRSFSSPVADPELPSFLQGQIKPRSIGNALKLVPLSLVPGFPVASNPPLYMAVNQERLHAYQLDDHGAPLDPSLFDVRVNFCEEVLLCETTLIVPDMTGVKGLNYRTGETIWTLDADENRLLDSLGIHSGVLHLFSVHRTAGDGGEILGVEPLTGHLLFRRTLPPMRVSTPPRFTGGQLIIVESYSSSEDASIHRIDPVTGNTVDEIPLLADIRRQLDLTTHVINNAMFVKRLFADEDTVYIPVNSRSANGPPRLAALRSDGTARWIWTGENRRTFQMHALRDDRVVIVEGANPAGTRIAVLSARSGEAVLERTLNGLAKVLNWELNAQPAPAPDVLLLTDMAPTLRLTCISLVANIRSFMEPLHREDLRVLHKPIMGKDFIAFGVQRRNYPLLLYALDLKTRDGALPGEEQYLSLPPGLTLPYEIRRHGPYTIVQSNEALTVFGNQMRRNK